MYLFIFTQNFIDAVFVDSPFSASPVQLQCREILPVLDVAVSLLQVIVYLTAQWDQDVQFPGLLALQQIVIGSVEVPDRVFKALEEQDIEQ